MNNRDLRGIDYEDAQEWFNTVIAPLLNCPKVQKMTDARRNNYRGRLAEDRDLLEHVEREARLVNDFTKEGTWIGFDFIFSKRGYYKFIEGQYRRKESASGATGAARMAREYDKPAIVRPRSEGNLTDEERQAGIDRILKKARKP